MGTSSTATTPELKGAEMSPVSKTTPVRLSPETKQKVQLAAALLKMTQGELVSEAVDVYLQSRSADLTAATQRAEKLLLPHTR